MNDATALTQERSARWRAVQPRRSRPWTLAPFVVWVVLVVLATVFADEGGCTVADPCGPTWWSAAETTLGMAAPVLLLWVPGPALWFSLLAGAVFVATEWGPQDQPRWFVLGFAVALAAATVWALGERTRREAAVRALLADVPSTSWPGAVPPLPRASAAVWLALLLATAGALVLAWGVQHGAERADAERAAPHVVGTVSSHGDDGYQLTVQVDGASYDIDSLDAEDYPVGSEQQIVLDGDDATLAVEQYDPSWALALAMALGLAGLALTHRSLGQRRRLLDLLTTPQPGHRVRLGAFDRGQVLPVDGPLDVEPLVALAVLRPGLPDVTPALLLGVPLVGRVAAVVLDDGTPLLPTGPVARPAQAWSTVVALHDDHDGELASVQVPDDVAAVRERLLRPRPWRRPLGVLLVVGAVAGGYLIGLSSDSTWTALWRCVLAASLAFDGLVHLTSDVELTDQALIHEGPTTRRTIPWARIRHLRVQDDLVLLSLPDDELIALTWLPRRPVRRGGGRRQKWANDWAAVLTDQQRRAPSALGAQVTTEPRLHAAVVAVSFVVAVILGLQVRSG